MSKDYEWELLRRIAAALELSPALFYAERPLADSDGNVVPLEAARREHAPEHKRLLDSLRLHKAFEAIEDEEGRLEALRAVEAISRRQAEGRGGSVPDSRAAAMPERD
jgi:hypothetical protein